MLPRMFLKLTIFMGNVFKINTKLFASKKKITRKLNYKFGTMIPTIMSKAQIKCIILAAPWYRRYDF